MAKNEANERTYRVFNPDVEPKDAGYLEVKASGFVHENPNDFGRSVTKLLDKDNRTVAMIPGHWVVLDTEALA